MRHVLMVDTAGRVVLGALDAAVRVEVGEGPLSATSDAGVGSRLSTVVETAVWSPRGQWTAWSVGPGASERAVDPLGSQHEVRIHHEGANSTDVLVSVIDAFYLSPSPCGRYLSHLSQGPFGLELGCSDVHSGDLTIIERGQPLFWSWAPDSSRLAVHVGERVLLVPVTGGAEPEVITEAAGGFVTPRWRTDGSVLYAEVDGRIMSWGSDGTAMAVTDRPTVGRFAIDPSDRWLTTVEVPGLGEEVAVVVTDLATGERTTVCDGAVAGFFWSPDGRRLAVLASTSGGEVRWLVHDGDRTVALEPFLPSALWVRKVLPFFEQYDQSHSVWSADSTLLVAPGLDDRGENRAIVQSPEDPSLTSHLPDAVLAWWAE